MGGRIRVVIDIAFYVSYAANWYDILPFDPLKENLRTSTGKYGPRLTHRGSVAQQSQRLSG